MTKLINIVGNYDTADRVCQASEPLKFLPSPSAMEKETNPNRGELLLNNLPYVPQSDTLRRVAPHIWAREEVVALWLGGSLARNGGDHYSDVDLRVWIAPEALEAWKTPDFPQLFPGLGVMAHQLIPFGETAFLHHLLLENGDIYDLWVQSAKADPAPETILVLGCRDECLAHKLATTQSAVTSEDAPTDSETVRQLLVHFWINSHKHRKVLNRDLHMLALIGLQHDRALLQRLWYILVTGRDYGEARTQTIFGLTHLTQTVEKARGEHGLKVLGASLNSPEAICRAIETYREEVSQAGQTLADILGFSYPHELEATVRHGWQEYLETL